MKKAYIDKDLILIEFKAGKSEFITILNEIKKIPKRIFKPTLRQWAVPKCNENIEVLKKLGFTVQSEIRQVKAIVQNTAYKRIPLPDALNFLYPFQKEGVQFLIEKKGNAVIADYMGLGKSAQAIGYLMNEPSFNLPACIVCPATVKINWKKELLKFWKNAPSIAVLSGGKSVCQSMADIVIINYDLLSMHVKKVKEEYTTKTGNTKTRTKFVPDPFLISFTKSRFKTIIFDESHYIKSEKSLRYQASHFVASTVRHKIHLTATPITNQPIDYWTTLNMLQPDIFGNRWQFGHRWCNAKRGWANSITFSGCTDPIGLNNLLKSTVMIRRLIPEVLKDLPQKIKKVLPVEISSQDRRSYESSEEAIFIEYGNNPIVKFAKLLTIIWDMKKSHVFSRIDDILETGEKVIVFAYHRKVITELMEKYPKISVKINGGCSTKQRDQAVEEFQNNPNKKLFFGNHRAAGVGLTLTASCYTIFAELSLIPTELEQAGGRNHRIGQTRVVNECFIVADNTLETEIMEILDEKRKGADAVLDGKITSEKELLSALALRYKRKYRKLA